MSYEQIISSGLYVRLKELVHSLAEHFQALVNKLHNLNVNSLKMPQKPSRVAQNVITGHMRPACLRRWHKSMFSDIMTEFFFDHLKKHSVHDRKKVEWQQTFL